LIIQVNIITNKIIKFKLEFSNLNSHLYIKIISIRQFYYEIFF